MSEVNSTEPVIDRHHITGLPGYHVSPDGRVWTSKKLVYFKGIKSGCAVVYDGPFKELKQQRTNQKPNYMVVVLTDANKKQKGRLVHRLVLEAFVGPCPDGMEGCHNDGDPTNNNVSNLRWATPTENCSDRKSHGRQCHLKGERNGRRKLTDEECVYIRTRYAAGGITYRELAEEHDVCTSTIRWVVIRGTWKHI